MQVTIDKSSVVIHKQKSGETPIIVSIEGRDYLVEGKPLLISLEKEIKKETESEIPNDTVVDTERVL